MNRTVFTAIKLPDEVYEYYWGQQTAHEGGQDIRQNRSGSLAERKKRRIAERKK